MLSHVPATPAPRIPSSVASFGTVQAYDMDTGQGTIIADVGATPVRFHYGDILMRHYKSLDPGVRVAFDVSSRPEPWATFIEPIHPDGTTPVRDSLLGAGQLH